MDFYQTSLRKFVQFLGQRADEVEAVKAAFDVLPERPAYKERPESGPIAAAEWTFPSFGDSGHAFLPRLL
jgi:hypothetical protein